MARSVVAPLVFEQYETVMDKINQELLTRGIDPTRKMLPAQAGWQVYDFKFASRRCVSQTKLQPIETHKERMFRIKKLQFGEGFAEKFKQRVVQFVPPSQIKDQESTIVQHRKSTTTSKKPEWNRETSPHSPVANTSKAEALARSQRDSRALTPGSRFAWHLDMHALEDQLTQPKYQREHLPLYLRMERHYLRK